MSRRHKYGILGGGAAGIGLGKSLAAAGLDFEIIEAARDFGGTWALGQESGLVYRSTHLISSKKNTEFADFPMPANYPHYPSHVQMLAYLRALARHFDLYSHTTFGTRVDHVEVDGAGCNVTLSNGERRSFSALLVANGRLRTPLRSTYPGSFRGERLHASEYRTSETFRGKRVLVLGGGNSGCDIAVDAATVAERTLHSTRRGYHYMPKFIHGMPTQEWLMDVSTGFKSEDEYWRHVKREFKAAGFDPCDYGLPKPDHEIWQAHPILNSLVLYYVGHGDIVPKPDVRALHDSEVEFVDGSREEIDVVVDATGYEMEFPFLSPALRPSDGVPELFMSTFHRKTDALLFCGYFNAAAGLGNLSSTGGALLVDYLRAREKDTDAFRILRRVVQGPEPDLGRDRFLKTRRHSVETDLWKALGAMNFLRAMLARS